ncbi:hypothetical protein MRX96_057231 [Rhipicephalus microplus]
MSEDRELLLADIGTSSSSGDESEDSEPVRDNGASTSSGAAKAPSRTSMVSKNSAPWIADKDNDWAGKSPDFLHNSDTLSFQNGRVAEMRPVIDALNEAFCSTVDPEECQFVDEMVIPFKGRSSIKQCLQSKPKRWGFKVWGRAGVPGNIWRFEVYQGATGG